MYMILDRIRGAINMMIIHILHWDVSSEKYTDNSRAIITPKAAFDL